MATASTVHTLAEKYKTYSFYRKIIFSILIFGVLLLLNPAKSFNQRFPSPDSFKSPGFFVCPPLTFSGKR